MYSFGKTSMKNLDHVHPVLVECAVMAIGISTQDFSVAEGCRSLAEEKTHVADGTSKTLQSYHLIQPDGFGHAIDLVPYDNGALNWDWNYIGAIVVAMRAAANNYRIASKLRWGGCWDRRLSQLDCTSPASIIHERDLYAIRHKGSDLLDGPHFELRL